MARRLELQALLEGIQGSSNVYFQPPAQATGQLKYPCIIYQRDYAVNQFAGNLPYRHTKRYQVTIISSDPDSLVPDEIAKLPMCTFVRFFATDGLNHDIYDLYF